MFGGFVNLYSGGYNRHDDNYYMGYGGGWGRDYVTTLYINWTMQSHADLSTETRKGYGCDLRLGVYATGTAVARYYENDVAVYDSRPYGQDAEGNTQYKQVLVGYRKEWSHDERMYVDNTQFCLVTNSAGAGFGVGQMLALPDGSPAAWSLPGDSTDYQCDYDSPYFYVRQPDVNLLDKDPTQIMSKAGLDPTLSLLIGHLATTEFSTRAIKEECNLNFPHDPRSALCTSLDNSPHLTSPHSPHSPHSLTYLQAPMTWPPFLPSLPSMVCLCSRAFALVPRALVPCPHRRAMCCDAQGA